ncbi:prepilin-type N-terminal cleavage/methylation domain-containing protein [Paenibacillus athensensis]|uniref:Prepilin-type N-terminal cleavage/methylation domain-containing protein n=1 Tax=Paenibacillus athensensis TaxID=1967502 RepID=A0A4Y8Q6V4_9BACL|nr:prepilin-type N-terminal cleavage/methylation domain-containing protein [Paenibacillus athensensis]MCD1257459.1 prepilin-type N-terminal cleavage/methylation domain-containing protein [Paenibacillus athensensis]
MRISNQKGFTLIELLAAISLMAIVMGLIFTILQSTSRSFSTISTRESSQERARQIAEQITTEVRRAPHIVSQTVNNGTMLNLAESSGDYMRLRFDAANHTLSKELRRGATAAVVTPMATNVSNVTVDLANSYSVTVNSVPFTTYSKITLNIVFTLPRNQTSTYSTVIYVPTWNQ